MYDFSGLKSIANNAKIGYSIAKISTYTVRQLQYVSFLNFLRVLHVATNLQEPLH